MTTTTMIEAIRAALDEEMTRNQAVILMGQDIAALGGAFRATAGLHERHGRARVMNTPIAESGTLGMAVGAAILGKRPVVEMQFADFVTCGFNQIVNNAAKSYYRWAASVPMVIRLPTGGGVSAGMFHSQNNEGWFACVPGLKVVVPSCVEDAKGLLASAIRDDNPVLYFEHKYLYRREKGPMPPEGHLTPLGELAVRRPGRDLTMVTWGLMVSACLQAATELAEEGIDCEVLDLRSLVPLDRERIVESVRRTSRALVVHEAVRTFGPGAEIAALINEDAFEYLDAPVRRVAYPDRPVPYARVLEEALLPAASDIAESARQLARY